MQRLLGVCIAVVLLSVIYVTPTWGKGVINIDTTESINEEKNEDVEVIEKDENNATNVTNEKYTLSVGIEEVFDVDLDDAEKAYMDIVKNSPIETGWTSARVNVRKEPNTDSEILDVLEYNEKINYQIYNDDWALITYNDKFAYVNRMYISDKENTFRSYSVPDNSGFKSYMSYEAITNKNSKQYKLQKNYAYTGTHGIRMIHDRYCIALGTYFNAPVGTYVDLVLENGTVIPCIVSEIKSDKHTDTDNITTLHNGCVTEFIVDIDIMNKNAKRDGDISSCESGWDSPVTRIDVYNRTI